jgi:hypothetical protein
MRARYSELSVCLLRGFVQLAKARTQLAQERKFQTVGQN